MQGIVFQERGQEVEKYSLQVDGDIKQIGKEFNRLEKDGNIEWIGQGWKH